MSRPPHLSPANLHDRPESSNGSSPRHPQQSTDSFALRLGLFYAAYFLFGGIQWPYFPLWLEAKGLDARAIGLVIAVPMLVRLAATPIVTHAADRRRALKAALVLCAAGATLATALLGSVDGLIAILLLSALAAIASAPVLALTDAYALTGLAARGRAYGPVRLWGSVAFIVANVGAGLALDWIAPGHLIWLIVAALAMTVVAAAALAPLEPGGPHAEAPAVARRDFWRSPEFLAVAATVALVQPSHALFYGFSTLEWRAAGLHGVTIGVLWGIGVTAEIVLFAMSARVTGALGATLLLVIGSAGAVIRWTAMAFDPPAAVLPLLQVLHAASFGATHLGAMAFLARAVPRELAATAQGGVATATGLVMAGATALSGLMFSAWGSVAYLAMAGMALAGFASALIAWRRAGS
jgi:PPP family 3-phenylpropionic acid transporter